jgi:hypothetical protein
MMRRVSEIRIKGDPPLEIYSVDSVMVGIGIHLIQGNHVLIKNDVFWKLRRVALVITDVSEELSASVIRRQESVK